MDTKIGKINECNRQFYFSFFTFLRLYSLLGWKEIYRNEEHSPHDINNYRRIKFEIAAGHSTQAVFLFVSFINEFFPYFSLL